MAKKSTVHGKELVEEVPLSEAAEYLLQECRMILPGIQAIFGFQLVAVFNAEFDRKFSSVEQGFHALALMLMAVAMVLVMTPAAYHRQTRVCEISETFVRLATRLLLISMLPFSAAILIDVFLVASTILGSVWAAVATTFVGGCLIFFWIIVPRVGFIKRAIYHHK